MPLTLAKHHPAVARDLKRKLAIKTPIDLPSADISSAIGQTTEFDKRLMNDKFAVDRLTGEDAKAGRESSEGQQPTFGIARLTSGKQLWNFCGLREPFSCQIEIAFADRS